MEPLSAAVGAGLALLGSRFSRATQREDRMFSSAREFVSASSAVLNRMEGLQSTATAMEAHDIAESLAELVLHAETRLAAVNMQFGPRSRTTHFAEAVTAGLRSDLREEVQELQLALHRQDTDAIYEAKEYVDGCRSFSQERLETFIESARAIRAPAGLRWLQPWWSRCRRRLRAAVARRRFRRQRRLRQQPT